MSFFNDIKEKIAEILKSANLSVKTRQLDKDLWEKVLNNCSYIPYVYTNQSLDYQKIYQEGHEIILEDLSMVIIWDCKPIALWPLSLQKKNGEVSICSNGQFLLAPLFLPGCAQRSIKKILNTCFLVLKEISSFFKIDKIESQDVFMDARGASQWVQFFMTNGAVCYTVWDMYLELKQPEDLIRSNFRKSYKPLISMGERHWQIGVLNSRDSFIWTEFKNLHLEVSGRKTRSDESWDIQQTSIENGKAFLVYLRDSSRKMVGGGFFEFSRDEGNYSVGAYDRGLFDKPLGHVVQNQAINEMKKRGVSWYRIGSRAFSGDHIKPSEKELSISEFKQGFSSHLFPRFILKSNGVFQVIG